MVTVSTVTRAVEPSRADAPTSNEGPRCGDPRAALDVERLRIATDVNDIVIRHLFAIGLNLHRTRATLPAMAQQRIDVVIGDLDIAINELRSVIFDLDTESQRFGP